MKIKPVDPSAVICDPHTKRALPPEGADVPETSFWIRRLRAGEVVRVDSTSVPPTGDEPIKPLTTR